MSNANSAQHRTGAQPTIDGPTPPDTHDDERRLRLTSGPRSGERNFAIEDLDGPGQSSLVDVHGALNAMPCGLRELLPECTAQGEVVAVPVVSAVLYSDVV